MNASAFSKTPKLCDFFCISGQQLKLASEAGLEAAAAFNVNPTRKLPTEFDS